MRIVRVRLQRIFAAMLLTVCIGAPALEMFDHWDHTLEDGNDTESNLVVAVLCVGVGFIVAAAVIRRVRVPLESVFLHAGISVVTGALELAIISPTPYASPPALLRV
jgi:hypothetical protein